MIKRLSDPSSNIDESRDFKFGSSIDTWASPSESFAAILTAYEAGMVDAMAVDPMTAAWTILHLNHSVEGSNTLPKMLSEHLVLAFK